MSTTISIEDLEKLEEKYFSPVYILLVQTDDGGPIYILKEGKKGGIKVNTMFHDLHKLIGELKKCVM